MKVCPCCGKNLSLGPLDSSSDMGNLFSCENCQSVLKQEAEELKVVYEQKLASPAPPPAQPASPDTSDEENLFQASEDNADLEGLSAGVSPAAPRRTPGASPAAPRRTPGASPAAPR